MGEGVGIRGVACDFEGGDHIRASRVSFQPELDLREYPPHNW